MGRSVVEYNDIIGKEFEGKYGRRFIVLKHLGCIYDGNNNHYYNIRFIETDYETEASRYIIMHNLAVDKTYNRPCNKSNIIGKIFKNNDGLEFKVLDMDEKYKMIHNTQSSNYKIQFIESKNIYYVTRSNITNGSISDSKQRLNTVESTIHTSKDGLEFIVTSTYSTRNKNGTKITMCKIKFLISGYETEYNIGCVDNGKVIDHTYKNICGGIASTGRVISDKNKNRLYIKWSRLIYMVYNTEWCSEHTICERWLTFTNFEEDMNSIGITEELLHKKNIRLTVGKKCTEYNLDTIKIGNYYKGKYFDKGCE